MPRCKDVRKISVRTVNWSSGGGWVSAGTKKVGLLFGEITVNHNKDGWISAKDQALVSDQLPPLWLGGRWRLLLLLRICSADFGQVDPGSWGWNFGWTERINDQSSALPGDKWDHI